MKFWYWYDSPHIKVAGDTYYIKDQLKSVGAFWEPKTKTWVLPNNTDALETVRQLKIPRRIKVLREAFCHTPEEEIWVSEDELTTIGTEPFTRECLVKSQFCSRCDSHYGRGGKVEVKRLE